MENDADTVTPLDEIGSDVEALAEQAENVSQDDYETKGQTTVSTPRGYAFVPNDKNIPLITHSGVTVTAEQAKALVAESDGLVRINQKEEE